MKKSVIYESALENDISKINYYSKEEKTLSKKIQNTIGNINSYYTSSNSRLLDEDLDDIATCFHDLIVKRPKYSTVLNNVIKRYNKVSKQVKNKFKGVAKKNG